MNKEKKKKNRIIVCVKCVRKEKRIKWGEIRNESSVCGLS